MTFLVIVFAMMAYYVLGVGIFSYFDVDPDIVHEVKWFKATIVGGPLMLIHWLISSMIEKRKSASEESKLYKWLTK